MIYASICNQSLNYIFYLEFIVHVAMFKQGIAYEEMLFAVCMASSTVLHAAVCRDLSWFASLVSYLAQFKILGDHIRLNNSRDGTKR